MRKPKPTGIITGEADIDDMIMFFLEPYEWQPFRFKLKDGREIYVPESVWLSRAPGHLYSSYYLLWKEDPEEKGKAISEKIELEDIEWLQGLPREDDR